jgi:hypothetical protein
MLRISKLLGRKTFFLFFCSQFTRIREREKTWIQGARFGVLAIVKMSITVSWIAPRIDRKNLREANTWGTYVWVEES